MRIKIAGGCGEHGRNCFFIESDSGTFLVDCGVMAGEEGGGFPHLTSTEIGNIKYVFLTHSHADHTGAIPWLLENGFSGSVVASEETLKQLPFKVERSITLEQFQMEEHPVKMQFGRSGHCVGSVWYQFECDENTLFFSGDYVEKNFVHEIDLIRGKKADIAVIDCAYGSDKTTFRCYCAQLIKHVRKMKSSYETLLFPVPKYGRGLELYWLLKKKFPKWKFYADAHFIEQLQKNQKSKWIRNGIKYDADVALYSEYEHADVVFVSDPQLKGEGAKFIAERVLDKNGYAIMTGTVEEGTMSAKLLQDGKMSMCRFPVHLNYVQLRKMIMENTFREIILYHSCEFKCVSEIRK